MQQYFDQIAGNRQEYCWKHISHFNDADLQNIKANAQNKDVPDNGHPAYYLGSQQRF